MQHKTKQLHVLRLLYKRPVAYMYMSMYFTSVSCMVGRKAIRTNELIHCVPPEVIVTRVVDARSGGPFGFGVWAGESSGPSLPWANGA